MFDFSVIAPDFRVITSGFVVFFVTMPFFRNNVYFQGDNAYFC